MSFSLRTLLATRKRRDAARLATQSAAAAAATYVLMVWLSLPEVSWAVISALFVVQQSANQTLQTAAGRVAGTAIGTVVGFLSIFVLGGESAPRVAARLAMISLALGPLFAFYPKLRYSVVTAAILALETDANLLDGALDRVFAISAGTICGGAAASLIFREEARARAASRLRDCLLACKTMLEQTVRATSTPPDQQILAQTHRYMAAAFRELNENLEESWRDAGPHGGPYLPAAKDATNRLWRALGSLEGSFVGEDQPSLGRSEAFLRAVDTTRSIAADALATMAETLRSRTPLPPLALDRLDDAVACVVAEADRFNAGAAETNLAVKSFAFNLTQIRHALRGLEHAFVRGAHGRAS